MTARSQTIGATGAPLESAFLLRDQLASGELSAEALVEKCIARIALREDDVRAWVWFDAEAARSQARRLDAHRASGGHLGPLHGLPVGLKDVIDTAGIPTQNGCPLDKGRVPERDAFLVERLRAAGAIIMGKTVTTELAYFVPGKTRNPHDLGHTPGGSSSGSAAAVADGMVPLAVGTQTGGSVVRPASFCGVTGYKPTFGAIPRRGVLNQSQTLDTLGVFAADPLSAAMAAEVLFGHDPADSASSDAGAPVLLNGAQAGLNHAPRFAILRPPAWDRVEPEYREALAAFYARLGAVGVDVGLPAVFETAELQRRVVNFAEMAHNFRGYVDRDVTALGVATQKAIEDGKSVSACEYLAAVDCRGALNVALDEVFAAADAILCPAALGVAPDGLSSTGDSVMNGLWTMAGTPAITLPLLTSKAGLPLGVQVVGRFGDDAGLLRVAHWLYAQMA
ncbi:amidase [uncultured Boseongicola sp.]|uniref:amidase n=1 Tax=uncultured Boseongicola sp. TaxID=1648499 RepID=UPI00260F0020|nr:amidase [uncultured Boseongicola sp.]